MGAGTLEPLLAAHIHETLNGRIPVKISDGQGNIQPFKYRGAVYSSYDGDTWFIEASVPRATMQQHRQKEGTIGVGFMTLTKYSSTVHLSPAYTEFGYFGLASGPWWAEFQLAVNPAGE